MKKSFVLTLSLFFSACVVASDSRPDLARDLRVQQALRLFEMWVEAKLAYDRVPGISMGLVSDQDLVWSKGFGYADVEAKRETTPQTIYSICSISKLFTSIAVMQQYEAGKLRLDDSLSDHLPWMTMKQAHPESGPLTIRSLLTHSSGLPRESNQPYWTGPDFPFPTRQEVIDGLSQQETLYPASRFFQYSNLGMTLLGQVVEQTSGEKYQDYVKAHILNPLGLPHTTPYLPEDQRGKLMATGYSILPREGERTEMPFFQAQGIAPAAGYASNVEDLSRFASWQFRLRDEPGEEVLRSSTLREMQRVQWVDPDWSTHWGLGFVVSEKDGETRVGHGGSCPGFRTQFTLWPQKKLAGIAMVNAMGVDPGEFVEALFQLVSPEIIKAREGAKPPRRHPEFEKYAGLYRSAWGETAIVPWEDGLAMLSLPSDSPSEGLTRLERTSEHVFRRIREDSDIPGEEIIFEVDPQGRVTRFSRFGNFSEKVQ